MQVTAIATPNENGWRWRIVNYAGDHIEESQDSFGSIAAALAQGSARLASLNMVDRSEPRRVGRHTPYVRRG